MTLDKPSITSRADLDAVRRVLEETSRTFAIGFSGRFVVPARKTDGRIGRGRLIVQLIQMVRLRTRRLNRRSRPDSFFDARRSGGMLVDCPSHGSGQCLVVTGSHVVVSVVHGLKATARPDAQDLGEIGLRSDGVCEFLDLAGRPGMDHRFRAHREGTRPVDCAGEPFTWSGCFLHDVCDRTQAVRSGGGRA